MGWDGREGEDLESIADVEKSHMQSYLRLRLDSPTLALSQHSVGGLGKGGLGYAIQYQCKVTRIIRHFNLTT